MAVRPGSVYVGVMVLASVWAGWSGQWLTFGCLLLAGAVLIARATEHEEELKATNDAVRAQQKVLEALHKQLENTHGVLTSRLDFLEDKHTKLVDKIALKEMRR